MKSRQLTAYFPDKNGFWQYLLGQAVKRGQESDSSISTKKDNKQHIFKIKTKTSTIITKHTEKKKIMVSKDNFVNYK